MPSHDRRRPLTFAVVSVAFGVIAVTGCTPTLTKEQEHGYRAVEECRKVASQQDWSHWVLPDGSIRFEGRADGFSPVQECLRTRYGYKF